jgi:CRP-like cAMP-binding protein
MDNPIWGNSLFKKKKQQGDILALLKQVPIFDNLKLKELAEVEKIMHRRKYKKSEPIIRMGDPGLGMYIIAKGSVDIIEEDKEGGSRTLANLKDGSFFGDLALLDESPRSASAVATEECDIIGFFRPDFLDLLDRKPKLGIKVLLSLAKTIGERLRRTDEMLMKIEERKAPRKNG